MPSLANLPCQALRSCDRGSRLASRSFARQNDVDFVSAVGTVLVRPHRPVCG